MFVCDGMMTVLSPMPGGWECSLLHLRRARMDG
jgi:hypothetical protein